VRPGWGMYDGVEGMAYPSSTAAMLANRPTAVS